MLIINIRGTSGSGKSTVVREVMKMYAERRPIWRPGRKRPLGYTMTRKDGAPGAGLGVIGHYETACGGCDTMPTMDAIFELMQDFTLTLDVMYEGLLISPDVPRIKRVMDSGHAVHVLAMDVPLEECLAGVGYRRMARGDTRPLNPKNTESKWNQVRKSMVRLAEEGVPCEWVTRGRAVARACELLRLP